MHDGKARNAIGIQLVLSPSLSASFMFLTLFIFGFQFYTNTLKQWTAMWMNRNENEKQPTELRRAFLAQTLTIHPL